MAFSLAGLNRTTGRFETKSAAEVYALLGIGGEITQLTMTLATTAGDQYRLAAQVTDHFIDTDGVDASASTDETYDAGTKRYSRPLAAGTAKSNNLTSNSAPSPNVVTDVDAGAYNPGGGYEAFDSSLTTGWFGSPGNAATLTRDFGSGNAFILYSYTYKGNVSYWNAAWVVEGSNDGSSWTLVDTVSGQTAPGDLAPTTHICDVYTTAYRYFRMRVAASGNYPFFADWTLSPLASGNMSLRSVAYTATVAPSTADLWILATSTASPGTTVRGYVTRDGATTWTEGTLTAFYTVGGFTLFKAEGIVLTAQPSGTDVRWRVDAAIGISVDAVSLKWRN